MKDMKTNDWNKVSNIEEQNEKEVISELYKTANQIAKNYCKSLEDLGIPVFTAYYIPQKGYRYKAVFPEEIGTPELESEFKKFNEFLKVCIDFNKKDYFF